MERAQRHRLTSVYYSLAILFIQRKPLAEISPISLIFHPTLHKKLLNIFLNQRYDKRRASASQACSRNLAFITSANEKLSQALGALTAHTHTACPLLGDHVRTSGGLSSNALFNLSSRTTVGQVIIFPPFSDIHGREIKRL